MSRDHVRPAVGLWIIVALLTAAGLNALLQVFNEISDPEPGSLMLGALQFATAISALLAAIAVARRDTRAPAVILAWGAISASLVVLLEPLGFVEAADRMGLWQGAAALLAIAATLCWYVRRTLVPRTAAPPAP